MKSAVDCPAESRHAVSQGFVAEACPLGPFAERKSLAAVFVSSHPASVHGLLKSSSPTHVTRLVTALIVDAIKRVFIRRPQANISQECGEIVAPTVADCNTSRPVILKLLVTRKVATLLHGSPCDIFRRLTGTMFVGTVEVSAGAGVSGFQSASPEQSLSAADTSTRIARFSVTILNWFACHGEPCKYRSDGEEQSTFTSHISLNYMPQMAA